jgi:chromate reductase
VTALVGSLRKESLTRKVALAMKGIAPPTLALSFVEIRDLQMYDEDLETGTQPREWVNFRDRILRAGALLFATPEYNHSVPGCLRNSVDVGSRPGGHGVFSGTAQLEAYVSHAGDPVDADNHFTREDTRMFLLSFPNAFAAWMTNRQRRRSRRERTGSGNARRFSLELVAVVAHLD